MKSTAIKGLPVRPEGSTQVTGTVSDLIFDLDERRVVALHVTDPDNQTVYVLDLGDVIAVGDQGLTAARDAVLLPLPDAPRYDTLPTFGRMLEEKAMTESGRILGKLADIDVDTRSWTVCGYAVVGSIAETFQHGEKQLSPAEVVSAGAHVLLVADSVTEM